MLRRCNIKEFNARFFCYTKTYFLADQLEIPIQNNQVLYSRLVHFFNELSQVLKHKPVQKSKLKTLCTFLHLYYACDVWC